MKLESSTIRMRARAWPLGPAGANSPVLTSSSPSASSSVRTFTSASSSSKVPAAAGTVSDRSIWITIPPPVAMPVSLLSSQLRLAATERANEHLAGARVECDGSPVPSADVPGGDRQAIAGQGLLDRLGILEAERLPARGRAEQDRRAADDLDDKPAGPRAL